MGAVHLGTMIGSAGRRRVALKQIGGRNDVRPDAAARLVAEAQLVFRLTHASICQVLDLAHSDDGTFIVMEYVDGVDLRTLLARLDARRTPLDAGSALYIAREIARALDYAHRSTDDHGKSLWLVHGDVTPPNILLSRAGLEQLARRRDDVTRELVDVIARAAAPRADARFASAAALEHALSVPFSRIVPPFVPSLLGRVVAAMVDPPSTAAAAGPTLVSMTRIGPGSARTPTQATEPMPRGTRRVAPRSNARRNAVLAAVVAVLALGGVGAWLKLRPETARSAGAPAPAPAPPTVAPAAPTPVVAPDVPPPVEVTTVEPAPSPPAADRPARRRKPAAAAAAAPAPAPVGEPGFVTVNAYPWGAVFVDGKRVAETTPVYRLALPPGVHRIHVYNPDRKARSPTRTVDVRAGKATTVGFEW